MRDKLPLELISRDQWVVADKDRVPYRAKQPIVPASSTKVSDWGDFDTALFNAKPHIGFVFASDDPYVGIDLDNKQLDNPQQIVDFHNQILADFADCYIERSISGTGYHVICKGDLGVDEGGTNNRINHVEMYQRERYFTVSGDVVNCPDVLPDKTELCRELYARLKTDGVKMSGIIESVPSTQTDQQVLDAMASASNWPAIHMLWQGKFDEYPSQSEADMALMSHLLFYTKDHGQATRLFMASGLCPSKRPSTKRKPKPEKYVQRTIQNALKGDPTLAVDLTGFIAKARLIEIAPKKTAPATVPASKTIETGTADEVQAPSGSIDFMPSLPTKGNRKRSSQYPKGLIGDIATYIHDSSIRPVPEVALAGALSLMAGLCGRAYNISGTGLNHYIMLLAGTGMGKEGAASGIDRIVNAVRDKVPAIDMYMGPASFASGQAVVKMLDEKPCFISVMGEFGITLQAMCSPRAPTHLTIMRRVMLDLYNKSGQGQMLRSSVYADSEKNTKSIKSPSMSMLGESNPTTFYANLNNSHIADGLIPRFNFIDYRGRRPARNKNPFFAPSGELVGAVMAVMQCAIQAQQNVSSMTVEMTPEAEAVFDAFDNECDAAINGDTSGGVFAEVWNRAHLKSLKLAALVAIGVHPYTPVIDLDVCEWAIEFTRTDISSITRRASDGELAGDEGKRLADTCRHLQYFLGYELKQLSGINKKMKDDRVVPYRWLYQRVKKQASFSSERRSSSQLLKDTLAFLCESGYLVRTPDPTPYGTTAAMYQIIDPNAIINYE